MAWEAHRTPPETLSLLDRLLDDRTDSETADALNQAGHRSGEGKAFTRRIVLELRHAYRLPSHAQRLRAQGLLTVGETADRLGVATSTIKAWNRAGLLTSHKANDKNQRLYQPPDPDDPRLVKRVGSPLAKRTHVEPVQRGAV